MKAKDFYELVQSGSRPVIEITQDYDEGADVGMHLRALSISIEDEGSKYEYYTIRCDLKEFEDYNYSFEKANWFDSKNNPTLRWRETSFYPSDGITEIYLNSNCENTEGVIFKVVEENKVYNKYLQEKNEVNYVKWLENKVKDLI